MITRRRPGIQENALVLPSSISVSSKGAAALEEKGFAFSISDSKRKLLTEAFLKTCDKSRKRQEE